MPTIHYREITYSGLNEAEVIDEQCTFDLTHFAQVSGQSPEWICALNRVRYFIDFRSNTTIPFVQMICARRAYRLQRDFDASLSAVSVMLDLIDEVHQLRRQIRSNQA
jgi:chaperone modulatory protein CbpM